MLVKEVAWYDQRWIDRYESNCYYLKSGIGLGGKSQAIYMYTHHKSVKYIVSSVAWFKKENGLKFLVT